MSFLVGTDPGLRQTRTPTTQEFTGSGQSSVTLSSDPGSEDNVIITFDGVTQHRSTYSVSGTTVSFSSAVPTGVAKIEATFTVTHPTKVPADNSVTLAKLADGTQGDVLYYAASGAPTLLGAGTSGHFLKTQGAGANPAWAAAGGAWEFVSTQTASTSSYIAFTGFTSGYDYQIVLSSVTQSANVAFNLQWGVSTGPTYRTSNYRYAAQQTGIADNTVTSDANLALWSGSFASNAVDPKMNLTITIFDPGNASERTMMHMNGGTQSATTAATVIALNYNGYHDSAEAVTAAKFAPASGTISGKLYLYRRTLS